MINCAGYIWNHALALQNRYYHLTGKYIHLGKLKSYIAHLRMKTQRYGWWQLLGSQAAQEILERLDSTFLKFFKKQGGKPSFKKVRSYRSFTLKQNGYKLLTDHKAKVGLIRIGQHQYKFIKHRPLMGRVKTVTVKRDSCRRLWICFSVEEQVPEPIKAEPRYVAGFDFGLKTFLTDHANTTYLNPQFFKQNLARFKLLGRQFSRKQQGSHNYKRAKYALARANIRISDKRRDYHFQLAHELCDQYDVLCFEDLNLDGMKRLWGRKVSDLAFGQFLNILKHVAFKRGKVVVQIERWERTTGKCSCCGHLQSLELRERIFHCIACGVVLDRDHNAAINICYAGASALGLEVVRPFSEGSLV